MKKPAPSAIRSRPPLTASAHRQGDPMARCNVCGKDDVSYLMRECDDRDEPIDEDDVALLFVGSMHEDCDRIIETHPRLYLEEPGNPGHFPGLCGPCDFRKGLKCTHPNLRANGGAGLKITMSKPLEFLCGSGGCERPIPHAIECVGRGITAVRRRDA